MAEVVEAATVDDIFYHPKHQYTQALLRSIPTLGRKSTQGLTSRFNAIKGTVPDPYSMPSGCNFPPRCCHAIQGLCNEREPELLQLDNDQKVRCVLYE